MRGHFRIVLNWTLAILILGIGAARGFTQAKDDPTDSAAPAEETKQPAEKSREPVAEAKKEFDAGQEALRKQPPDFATALKHFTEAARVQQEKSNQDNFFQAYLGAGVCHLRLKQFEQAVGVFTKASNMFEGSYEAWAGLGEALYEIKEYKGAVTALDNALNLVAKAPDTLYYRGRSQAELRELDLAAEDLEAAIAINRQDKRYYAGLGQVRLSLGDIDKALAALNRAEELDMTEADGKPDLAEIYSWRGIAYSQIPDRKKALPDLIRAAELAGGTEKEQEYWLHVAQVQFQDKNYEAAREAFDRAEKAPVPKGKESSKLAVFLNRARARIEYGKMTDDKEARQRAYENAVVDCDKAIELEARNPLALLTRGMAYRLLEKWREAIESYNEALSLNSEIGEVYFRRALVWFQLNELQIAQKDLNDAIQRDNADARSYLWRGIVKARLGEYLDAIADYTTVLRLRPTNVTAYHNRALAYMSLQDYDKAIADLNEAIRFNQKDAVAHFRRGVAYARKGENERAVASYTSAVELDPKYAQAYFNRGAARERMGDRARASSDFSKARQLDPSLQ
jgi:tetratricopeptide (TPR) repeat protein